MRKVMTVIYMLSVLAAVLLLLSNPQLWRVTMDAGLPGAEEASLPMLRYVLLAGLGLLTLQLALVYAWSGIQQRRMAGRGHEVNDLKSQLLDQRDASLERVDDRLARLEAMVAALVEPLAPDSEPAPDQLAAPAPDFEPTEPTGAREEPPPDPLEASAT